MSSMLRDISVDVANFSSKNGARLSLSIDVNAKAGRLESKVVFYDANSGGIREHANVDWAVVSLTSIRRSGSLFTFALGEDGQVLIIEKERVWERPIVRDERAATRGPLRKVRPVGSTVVAVGMDRQVFFNGEDEVWRDVSATGTEAKPVTGFEAVAGTSVEDLYCAGWRGEVWHRRGNDWRQLDSPTNILIHDLFLDGEVLWGCGLAGLVLRYQGGAWEVLDQGAFNLDLYSVAVFGGRVFFASLYGNYELRDGKLYDVDYDVTPPTTGHTLCNVGDALAAVGAKDMLMFDGSAWRRLE
jgi:hypothetical protein